MNRERWRRVEEICSAAFERTSDRATFLDELCGGDDALRREVERLIASDEQAGSFLQAPAWEVVGATTVAGASSASPIGARISHYEILSSLGAGGMGEVYRARDTRMGREVAFKRLPARFTADPERLRRFEQEVRAASALNHPNIVTVHDLGESDAGRFIVMELVEGRTLRELADEALSLASLTAAAAQVARALAAAHAAGIVHCDIKPENVMVRGDGYVKVLDFGVARLTSADAETAGGPESVKTGTGTLVGTMRYMSPEQARGDLVNGATDIFSLGIVLYELATRRHPFADDSEIGVLRRILSDSPVPPAQLDPGIPAALERLILQMLETDPRMRPTARDVDAALAHVNHSDLTTSRQPAPYRRRRIWWAAAGLAAAVAAAIASGLFDRESPAGTADPRIASLAVLPVENLSGDSAQEHFADGFTDALITELSKTKTLKVISRRSVMEYKGVSKPLREIVRELEVDGIIEGSVLREGGRVRFSAQLIEAGTEMHLWSDSYERDLRDVLRLQSEVARTITRQIRAAVTRGEQGPPTRAVNPEAYEAYLKGMFYLRRATLKDREQALMYLQQAVDRDPMDPLAYAGLARAYSLIITASSPPGRFPDAYPRALAAALHAEELGGMSAETQTTLAHIALYSDWDVAGAERYLRSALELNPSSSEAHRDYSWYLNLIGRVDEAFAELRRAHELDPLSEQITGDLGYQYWMAGQYDAAVNEGRKTIELNPRSGYGFQVTGRAYAAKGMYAEAIAAHQQYPLELAHTYALAGRRVEARKLAAELEKGTPPDARQLAAIYAALGEKDEAFRWLETAYRLRVPIMPWIRRDPEWIPLRGDPRFEHLARRIGVPAKGYAR